MENSAPPNRKSKRKQLTEVWRDAYRLGKVTIDYGAYPDGHIRAEKLHRALRNWYTILRRKPESRIELWELAQCCSLRKLAEGGTSVVLVRTRLLGLESSIDVLAEPLPVSDKLTKPTESILQSMRKNLYKRVDA